MFKWIRNALASSNTSAQASAKIDAELQQIITDHNRTRESATAIRNFLLKCLQEDRDGIEKFNDEILQDAAALLEKLGPSAFYWMTDIAVQMTNLSRCALAGIPTNIEAEVGKNATSEEIVLAVVVV